MHLFISTLDQSPWLAPCCSHSTMWKELQYKLCKRLSGPQQPVWMWWWEKPTPLPEIKAWSLSRWPCSLPEVLQTDNTPLMYIPSRLMLTLQPARSTANWRYTITANALTVNKSNAQSRYLYVPKHTVLLAHFRLISSTPRSVSIKFTL